jgi:hypothetical protein
MPSQIAEGANKNMLVYQICTYLEKYLKKNVQFAANSAATDILRKFIG